MTKTQLASPPDDSTINISKDERIFSLIGGSILTTLALFRRGALSLPALLLGIGLFYRGLAGTSFLYKATGTNTAIKTNSRRVSVPHQQGVHVTRAVTINRPIEELYTFWHNLTNLPRIMNYVESVEVTAENRSHWTLKLPGDLKVEFDAETYTDVPNEVISWRSLPDAQVQNAGSVRFRPAPGDRGTEISLTIEFVPPGGPLGQAVLNLFGEIPAQYVGQSLREFKQAMETGEKASIEGQTSGRTSEVLQ
jgi:uncharacterized membrane protein